MSNTLVTPVATINDKPVTPASTKPDFGQGRYSPVMEEFYGDLCRLTEIGSEAAEKAARELGRDLGRYFAGQSVAVKYGRANKDGKLNLAEAAKLKGVTMTHAITLAAMVAGVNDLNKSFKACRVEEFVIRNEAILEWLAVE